MPVTPAIRLKQQLMAQGMSNPEAEQVALEFLIPENGPEFGDDPTPLSLEDQMKVTQILDDREQFRRKLRARQQKQSESRWKNFSW
jgi:hypothetical protein